MKSIRSKASDQEFGKAQEVLIQKKLEEIVGCKLRQMGNGVLDYINDDAKAYDDAKVIVEVKSRRINHNQYATALLGFNKIEKAKGYKDKEIWFFWNYNDRLTSLKFNEPLFDTYLVDLYKRGFRVGGNDTEKPTIFVPLKDMTIHLKE
jgi:hypothetical protein